MRDQGTPEMEDEFRGHDSEEVDSLVNYRPSGHALMKDKGFVVVNRRPPTMPSNAWASIGPVHKLVCLNAYRRTLNLREAKTWDDMVVYLTEEHLPSKLPANHKFPWGARAPKGTVARYDDDGTEKENAKVSDRPRDVDGTIAAATTDTRHNNDDVTCIVSDGANEVEEKSESEDYNPRTVDTEEEHTKGRRR